MNIKFSKTIKINEPGAKADQAIGFTLMEMLVATSIFVILTLGILTIHTTVLKNTQKTLAYNKIQQDAQVTMESIAKKIRTSRVDYDYYTAINNPVTELALTDLTGTNYVFALSGASLTVSVDGNDPQAIPARTVEITDLKFYIQPTTFPFNINFPPETQPRVTMVVTFTSSKGAQMASLTVQQTVPQRSGGVVE